jgi:hypothetical protein
MLVELPFTPLAKHFLIGRARLILAEAMIKRPVQLFQAEMVRTPGILPVQKRTMRFMLGHSHASVQICSDNVIGTGGDGR